MPDRADAKASPSRQEVDAAIEQARSASGEDRPIIAGKAANLLASYWRATPCAAAWVAGRFDALAPTLRAPTCDLLVLRSSTLEPVAPLARACAAEYGLQLTVRFGEFNAWTQEALDPTSIVYGQPPPDVVLLAVQTRDISPSLWQDAARMDGAAMASEIDRVCEALIAPVRAIREQTGSHILIHGLEKPSEPSLGILDSTAPAEGSQSAAIDRINARLREAAGSMPGVYVLDYDGLVARHGRARWGDEDKFLTVRLGVSAEALLPLAREWMRYVLPLMGRQCKCLVLDLDNTLWGGIVGEDGPGGIRLGVEHPGAHYQAIQRAALDLSHRGILLAVCSKNNPADAMEVLDNHPAMLLRQEHFASLRVNWNDKAQNMREIAQELNIGLDSLALLDDNPVEREMIRSLVPEAHVIEPRSSSPQDMLHAIRQCPLFERVSVGKDDRERGKMYAQQRQRAELESSAASIEDYLRSLDMEAQIGMLEPGGDAALFDRVAQLTQKTNQLNMTTRRCTVQEVIAMAGDPAWRIYWISVRDRFGDNGVVGVMFASVDTPGVWKIDTFLMSCRVIGRTVETCMLATLAQHAIEAGAHTLEGWFRPTRKNAPAQAIYKQHGFKVALTQGDDTLWRLDLPQGAPRHPQWILRTDRTATQAI